MHHTYRRACALFIALGVVTLPWAISATPGDQVDKGQGKPQTNNVYIVQMVQPPVVSYEGGIDGLAATKPRRGQKIDPFSPEVVRYASFLDDQHGRALNAVGGGRKLYDYRYTYNGFAAELTSEQADALASLAGVVAVTKDELQYADTSTTPTFLGLTDKAGLWNMLGGVGSAGEDIIIGLIDSGIWPEHPSFSDRTGLNGNMTKSGRLGYQQIPGWHGKCTPGEAFNASMCNQKLIGAQWFNEGYGGNAGIDAQRPWEFNSVRDYQGHGSHTASTAGGNNNIMPYGPAAFWGPISGIAPRARIAMYKALWSLEDASQASGYNSDLVAAIDQAVADGVDVINYSISGTRTSFREPVQVAFMYAADAGIFVAASAGNSGPTTATVAHPGPWLTTVAAGTHNRNAVGSVTLGNGTTYTGVSTAMTAAGPAPFIDSAVAGLPGANPTMVALCYAAVDNGGVPVLDPAKVAGKIVLCDRGVTARVNKSLAVYEAGGIGMVLVNVTAGTLNPDIHSVPSVHLQNTDRAAVKAYAATAGATATINPAQVVLNTPAPNTASFSSRGPLLAGGGDLLKPDVMAPGVDILAAVAPPGNAGQWFASYQGTSMSSPHVAGLAALLKNLHPEWTPMMIKSALMTSAYDVLDGPNTNPLVIFRQGAGHVKPNSAADPGLVFNSGWNDWLAFICSKQPQGIEATCNALWSMGYARDASDFNVASIAIGDLAGTQTVTRKVTNVGASVATYNASYTGLAGFNVVVDPATLTLNPGDTKRFTVTFTRTTATLNAYTGGQMTWTDGTHSVRIPVVLQPVALAAPTQVSGSYNVTFGYNGAFTATARGLVPATTFDGAVSTGQQVPFTVTVPAGATYARFSLFDANVAPPSDLDLVVYGPSGAVVGSSAGGTTAEEVNVLNPAAGNYVVVVDGYATANPSTFTLFTWVLGSTAAGNMTVTAPATATIGATGAINLSFSGLTTGTKYLGSVAYGGAAGMPNPTIVRVDP